MQSLQFRRRRIGWRAPLSLQQERLVQVETLFPSYQRFHRQHLVLEFSGELSIASMQAAVARLISTQQVLRSRIIDDQWLEPDDRDLQNPILVRDAVALALPVPDEDALIRDSLLAVSRKGPLWNAELSMIHAYQYRLALVIHHIVFDYWSMGIVLRELCAGYQHALENETRQSAPVPVLEYSDYALWQRERTTSAELQAQRSFWREHLRSAPSPCSLRLYRAPSSEVHAAGRQALLLRPEFKIGVRHVALCEDDVQCIACAIRNESITPYMALLCAFILTLRAFGAPERILIATPVACRPQPEISNIVGLFANVVPLVFSALDAYTISALCRSIRTTVLNGLANQEIQFQEFEKLAGNRLAYQFMFHVQNAPVPAAQFKDLAVRPLSVSYGADYVELSLKFTKHSALSGMSNGLAGEIYFDAEMLDDAAIARFWAGYRCAIRAVKTGSAILADTMDAINLAAE